MTNNDLDVIGFWSEAKLEVVRDYASEYSKILRNQSSISRHIYIDAFAGAGVHISKKTGDFVPGSPLNALNVRPPFTEYHFIDLDEKRVQGLQDLANDRSDVMVYPGDCNEILLNQVFPRCQYGDYARGLCLLDPYKLSVDWKVLQTAGEMRSVEIFYNFMIMDANRNVLWKNPENVSDENKSIMNRVWGDSTWKNVAYRKEQRGLFKDFHEDKASNESIAKAFQARLRKVAGFKYVPDPIPMQNKSGAIIYYLYFASPDPTANRIVKHIFKKYAEKASYG